MIIHWIIVGICIAVGICLAPLVVAAALFGAILLGPAIIAYFIAGPIAAVIVFLAMLVAVCLTDTSSNADSPPAIPQKAEDIWK